MRTKDSLLTLSHWLRLITFLIALIFSQKEALALDDFLMAVPSKTICSAYLFIGKDQGFFTDEGIDLKLVLIPVSVAPMAILAQQIHGMEYTTNGVSMRANGAPAAMVFAVTHKPSWFLFSNPAITHLKQLSGKSVSVGVLGSGSHTMTVEFLKEAGVDPNSVVFVAGRGGSDVRIQMLANGTVQAATLVPPYNFHAEKQGLRQLMFYGDKFDLAQCGLVLNESIIKTSRPLLKRVVRGFLRSHLYTLSHRARTVQWISTNLKMGNADADRFFDLLVKIAPPNGIPSESAIQNVLTMNTSAKSRSNRNQELADFTLLEEIHREMRGK
jgi:ABC-type nitrate/sulfonate/bicarbonate transport system substrate-binding protein